MLMICGCRALFVIFLYKKICYHMSKESFVSTHVYHEGLIKYVSIMKEKLRIRGITVWDELCRIIDEKHRRRSWMLRLHTKMKMVCDLFSNVVFYVKTVYNETGNYFVKSVFEENITLNLIVSSIMTTIVNLIVFSLVPIIWWFIKYRKEDCLH